MRTQGVTDQDAHIAGYILDSGRAVVIAINKWDGLDADTRERVKSEVERKMPFLSFARRHNISAKNGHGLTDLMRSVDDANRAAFAKLSTPKLTRALMEAVERQAPPRRGNRRPKLRYAHQGGQNPPVIVIHGNALDRCARGLPPLSGGAVPRPLRTGRHAAADRVQDRPQPLRTGLKCRLCGVVYPVIMPKYRLPLQNPRSCGLARNPVHSNETS